MATHDMSGHDALARIEPVARELLARVDAALVSHGAPADHEIWSHLRRLQATPADAVAFFVAGDVDALLAAAATVRGQADSFRAADIPAGVAWQGTVGELYAAQAAALHAHLGDGLGGRLADTASYVEEVAAWWRESRGQLAVALAEVLTSAQAVEFTGGSGGAGSVGGVGALGPAPAGLRAAADIGAHVLAVAVRAHDAGYDLLDRWSRRLDEVPYRPPVITAADRFDVTIDVRH